LIKLIAGGNSPGHVTVAAAAATATVNTSASSPSRTAAGDEVANNVTAGAELVLLQFQYVLLVLPCFLLVSSRLCTNDAALL